MEQDTFITLLIAIIGVSLLVLFQIYSQRDKLLDKIFILDLYGTGVEALRIIKDIEDHPRASLITNGYYVQARQQLSSFSNGLIVNVIIFITPLIINILGNVCINDQKIIFTLRYSILFLSFVWIIVNIYWLRKYDSNNRKILRIT